MHTITLHMAQRQDLERLSEWLVANGQAPQVQCLHTWTGQNQAELWQGLLVNWDNRELCYILALQEDELVGAMGCEFDEELGRAWLYGPHVIAPDWELVADELYNHLLEALPTSIRQWNAYLNVENQRGRHFYTRRDFLERPDLSFDFSITAAERIPAMQTGCIQLDQSQADSFTVLYEALFPSAYYSASRLLRMLGTSHQVLVIAEQDHVLGFAVLFLDEQHTTGEIQFLGVKPDCQRRGYGRRLLLASIDWFFDVTGVQRVTLNVNAENEHARHLYESAGFRLRYTGIGISRA